MPPEPIKLSGSSVDLSPRYFHTETVVASPALAAETIIASVTVSVDVVIATGIQLWGWAAYTVGTAGVSVQFRIRRTDASGTIKGNTGAITEVAANLGAHSVQGIDTGATIPGQVYVLTMQVASGGAVSTVSAVQLCGLII